MKEENKYTVMNQSDKKQQFQQLNKDQINKKKRKYNEVFEDRDYYLLKKEKNKRRKQRQKQNKKENIKYLLKSANEINIQQNISHQQIQGPQNHFLQSQQIIQDKQPDKNTKSYHFNEIIFQNQDNSQKLHFDMKLNKFFIGRYKQALLRFGYEDQEISFIQINIKNYPYFRFFYNEAKFQFNLDCSKKISIEQFLQSKPFTCYIDIENPLIPNIMNGHLQTKYYFQKNKFDNNIEQMQLQNTNQLLNSIKISNNNGDYQLMKVFSNIQDIFSLFNSQKYDNEYIAKKLVQELENLLQCQFFIEQYNEHCKQNNIISRTSNKKQNFFMQFTNNQFLFPHNSQMQQLKDSLIQGKNSQYKYAIVQRTDYGIKRYTDKQIQYQGEFSSNKLWYDVINDINKVNEDYGYDLIIADPPWDETAIKFKYTIQSDEEWMKNVPLKQLQKQGFLGMWVTNSKLESCLNYLSKNDYERIDMIPWLKMKEDGTAEVSIGYYLLHGFELFILAKKKNCQSRLTQICQRQSALGIIVSSRRETSRKPDELYYIKEKFMKENSYKLELFGRKYNWRDGWTTIGNEAIYIQKDCLRFKQYPKKCEQIINEQVSKQKNEKQLKKQMFKS